MSQTPDNPSDIDRSKTSEDGEKAFKEFRQIRNMRFSPTEQKNRSIKDLISTRQKLFPEWSAETKEFVDELYSRLEWAETGLEVFNARLKGEWTLGSKLYTKKELNDATNEAYNAGYRDGKENFYGKWKTQT